MTDRNTISQVVESLFEDWIDKNINVHPLAVENMRMLEADALAMLKEQDAVKPTTDEYGNKRCGYCGHKLQSIADQDLFCCKCGKPVLWEGR